MRPAETILGMEEERIKASDIGGWNSTVMYYKNFLNATVSPQYNNNMTKKN
jgi:hypothetical protein